METMDIYYVLTHKSGRMNPVVLYGRINEQLPELPKMVSTCTVASDVGAYVMDLYAWQSADEHGKKPNTDVQRTSGRLVVFLPKNKTRQYTATALICGIYYNRFYTKRSGEGEANLVIGGNYVKNPTGGFSVVPARYCTEEYFGVLSDEDKRTMAEELVYAPRMRVDKQVQYLMGYDCPLLTGDTLEHNVPAFFEERNSSFGCIDANLSARAPLMLRQRRYPMTPKRIAWGVTVKLAEYLGIVDEYNDRPVQAVALEDAELEPRVDYDSLMTGVAKAAETAKLRYLAAVGQQQLPETDAEFDVHAYIDRLYDRLSKYWNSSVCGAHNKETGRKCVTRMLEYLYICQGADATTAEKQAKKWVKDVNSVVLLDVLFDRVKGCSDSILELYYMIRSFGTKDIAEQTFIVFVFTSLDLHSSFVPLIESGLSGRALIYIMLKSTYWLGYIATAMPLKEIDALACFAGNAYSAQDVRYIRTVLSIHEAMTSLPQGSIVCRKQAVPTGSTYDVSRAVVKQNFETRHTLISAEAQRLSTELLDVDNQRIPQEAVIRGAYTVSANYIDSSTALQTYIDSGLGVEFIENGREYVIDLTLAMESIAIYDRLRARTGDDTGIKIKNKATVQHEYQLNEGIELEEQQAYAVNLLEHKVSALIGGPGSGKTTTLKYLIYCLKHAGLNEENILMLAPTGMAASRMTACTGHEAKTIHSALQLRDLNFTFYVSEVKQDTALKKVKWVFIDEASMLSVPLLYQCLTRLPTDVNLLFIGDINQLPPIDTGKPFIDMLNFVPYVRLNVTKRTTNDSAIAQNCQAFITSKTQTLRSDGDVRLIDCAQEDFRDMVCSICRSHMDRGSIALTDNLLKDDKGETRLFYPNDIQVISPMSKAKYLWGTKQLNQSLREVFNPFVKGESTALYYSDIGGANVEYRVRDRILNKQNHYGISVFERVDPRDDFNLISKTGGVLNGAIGYIVAIAPAKLFHLYCRDEEDHFGGLRENYKLQSLLGVGEANAADNDVVMLVEYTDMTGKSFMTLTVFAATGVIERNTSRYEIKYTPSLGDIDLAYAVTVHKMQGSQAELVICPAYSISSYGKDQFINRNMIFTMMSRAKSGLYMVGDVTDKNSSPLYTSRNAEANTRRISLFDTLYDV